jgi:hypothetical protein
MPDSVMTNSAESSAIPGEYKTRRLRGSGNIRWFLVQAANITRANNMSAPKSFRQLLGLTPSNVTASSPSTALIIIDAQQSYSSTGLLAISGIDEAQKVIASTVGKFRKGGSPVIWIQHDAGPDMPVFCPGTPSFDFIGDVRPTEGEKVIVKKAISRCV